MKLNMEVELILSIVLAGCTAIYTLINLFMLLESRKVRLQKITPHIIAYIKSSEDSKVLELIIENIGEGVAKRVNAKLLSDYKQFGVSNNSLAEQSGIFKDGFNNFPPHYRLCFLLNTFADIDYKNAHSIQIELTYQRQDGKIYSERFDLIFEQLLGQLYMNPPQTYIGKIPYQINELNKTLKKLTEYIKENRTE